MADRVALPKKLLLAVDSQGACEHALHMGLWLARALPAEVECVHAFPPRPILWNKASQAREWELGTELTAKALQRMLAEFAQRAPADLGPLVALPAEHLSVVSGHAAALVLEHAQKSGTDLLLLGPHSPRPGLDFGNTARALLSKADCPVWIQPVPARPVRRIAVATDLSEHAQQALRFALQLAQRLDASVTAVHVFEPPVLGAVELQPSAPAYVIEDIERETRRGFDEQMQRFEASGARVSHEFTSGRAVEGILALEERFDLVVMGTHGHTGFAAALLGSVTHAVARSIRTGLCVVPFGGRPFLR